MSKNQYFLIKYTPGQSGDFMKNILQETGEIVYEKEQYIIFTKKRDPSVTTSSELYKNTGETLQALKPFDAVIAAVGICDVYGSYYDIAMRHQASVSAETLKLETTALRSVLRDYLKSEQFASMESNSDRLSEAIRLSTSRLVVYAS